jgi:DnaJ-class molecular chaperone
MIEKAAKKLAEIPEEEVRQRYERLAKKYHLKLEWKVD